MNEFLVWLFLISGELTANNLTPIVRRGFLTPRPSLTYPPFIFENFRPLPTPSESLTHYLQLYCSYEAR